MAVDVRVPEFGESVTEATLVRWLKQDGDLVRTDEPLLELESEKASMDVVAEADGRLRIATPAGARVESRAVVGRIEEVTVETGAAPRPERPDGAEAPSEPPRASREPRGEPATVPVSAPPRDDGHGDGAHQDAAPARVAPARPVAEAVSPRPAPRAPEKDAAHPADAEVERVPMSDLRRTIASRLVEVQRTAAILTTVNEIDLGELLALRARHRERFKARHGVDLGLVSLFARATVQALREERVVNARIDGGDIVYHRHVHLGIAVATPRGLVVPVIRGADALSLGELERAIGDLAARARDGALGPRDLTGGTFTITNGGVFGSLLSTPILNPPQSGILGMHTIQDRPVARDGAVVIRPMMYVALSYDHRLVDGKQAVTFLVRVKEQLEDPARMVLEV
jgi:2-oxoglutarate dehydrogenase E2 component (dihydrolipoamide succinyltransferase)